VMYLSTRAATAYPVVVRGGALCVEESGRLMRLVLLGMPGAGKGTQARLLEKRLGLAYIGTGEILRDAIARRTPTGVEIEPLMREGRLVDDRIVNEVVADLLRAPNRPTRFVTDGYPRTYAQVISFDALLKLEHLELDRVVNLTISDDEVVRRMLARGRADDNEATIRRRLAEFHKNNNALVEYYLKRGLLREVPAVGAVEDIYAKILCALGLCDGPTGAPAPEGRTR
jgi:adenylate kinase